MDDSIDDPCCRICGRDACPSGMCDACRNGPELAELMEIEKTKVMKFRISTHIYETPNFPLKLMELDMEGICRKDHLTGNLGILCEDHQKALEACRICLDQDILFDVRPESVDLTKDEIEWIKSNHPISAIKSVRLRTGMGLKEAKDFVMQQKFEKNL